MTGNPVWRLLSDFRHFAGSRLALLSVLMIGGALAEGLGIILLVPLLAITGDPASLPNALQSLSGLLPSFPGGGARSAALALFILLMLLRSVLLYGRDVTMARLEAGYTADMRLRAAATLGAAGWKRASRLGPSGMQSLLLTEIPRCIYAAHESQVAAVAIAMLVIQFGLAFLLSPSLASVALLLVASGLFASWLLLKNGRRRGMAISAHAQQSNAEGYRLHAGLKAALVQGTVPEFLRDYDRSLEGLTVESVGFARDRARIRALAAIAAASAAVVLIVVGEQWLQLPIAVLATLLVLFARMSGPAQSLQQSLHALAVFAPAFDAVEGALGRLRREVPARTQAVDAMQWRQLRLHGVAYSHHDGGFGIEVPDFTLTAGEWVGIAGPSGGGKTTFVDVAAGLIPPDRGRILVDGRTLSDADLAGWRQGIAYIGQNEQTFEGTLRQNLAVGSVAEHDDARLWAVLEAVGLDSRLSAAAEGLDLQVGDRGSSLSGGERQRLAIARALLREPRLLILDEATNAIDQDGEVALLERLRRSEPRPALLLVAHRHAPLDICDRILRVANGRIG
jgi:ATP-binding cassette subfamily C protein